MALLLKDVINDLEFEGGRRLLTPAQRMADELVALKDAAYAANMPTIYVNDNFGRWQSNFDRLIEDYDEPKSGRLRGNYAPAPTPPSKKSGGDSRHSASSDRPAPADEGSGGTRKASDSSGTDRSSGTRRGPTARLPR